MDNMRQVIKNIVNKNIPLSNDAKTNLKPLKQILISSASSKRKCRQYIKSHKKGPQLARSISYIVQDALNCPAKDHKLPEQQQQEQHTGKNIE
jgi:hypothetical protein